MYGCNFCVTPSPAEATPLILFLSPGRVYPNTCVKTHGHTLPFKLSLQNITIMLLNYQQRNADFLRAARRVARQELEAGRTLSTRSLIDTVLRQPAPAYYVSAEYVLRRMRLLKSGRATCSNPRRAAMLDEIEQKFNALRQLHPQADPFALLDDMLGPEGPGASSFFLSPEYALRLFSGSARREPTRRSRRRCPHSRPGNMPSQTLK